MYKVFPLFFLIRAVQSNAPTPRGVPLSQSVLYNPAVDFTCLDGLNTVPFSYVNDDYCDCNDASDEPGTSACPNGHYYCANKGFRPVIIPSSRVNDGVCDCCDGSDEWNNQSACHNNCKEMFRKEHAELIRQAEEANKGFDIRQQYASIGMQVKTDNKAKLTQLKQSLDIISKQLEAVSFDKEQAETAEVDAKSKEKEKWEVFKKQVAEREDLKDAVAAFVSLDIDRDAMVTVQEILPHKELSTNGEELTEEQAKQVLLGQESVEVDGFLEIIWPMISSRFVFIEEPEPVEKAESNEEVQEVFDIEAEYPEADEDEEEDEDYEEEDGLNEADDDNDDDEEEEEGYWDESGKHTVPAHEDDKPEEASQDDNEEKPDQTQEAEPEVPSRSVDLPDDPPYNPVTRILMRAADDLRKQHKETNEEKSRVQREIDAIEDSLDFDFGADEAFYSLKGECFELKTLEYIYKLCPFDKSVQLPIKGGSETSLGKWEGWSGPDDNKYSEMKYTRGLKCWNGPDRSTTVVVSCGSENKVLSASEPSRCEYKFEFTTPAICKKIFVPQSHDEL